MHRHRRRRLFVWLLISLVTATVASVLYGQFFQTGDDTSQQGEAFDSEIIVENENALLDWIPDLEELQTQFPVIETLVSASLFEDSLGTETEGALLVYSSVFEDDLVQYITAFRTQYPDIIVQYETMSDSELSARIIAERAEPQADVIWGTSATSIQTLAWQDTLTPYAPATLDTLPHAFRDNLDPPEWVGFAAWMNAFCVNKQMLIDAGVIMPQTWADLTSPTYEGMILVPDPTQSQTGYLALQAVIELYGEVEAWQYLDALDANVLAYSESSTWACEDVADGLAAIAVSYALIATQIESEGAAVEAIFPTEGTGWDMEAAALIRKFPVKPAAKTLMDFIISEDATHHYAQTYAVTAIELDYTRAPFGYPDDPASRLTQKDFVWAGANRNRLLAEWQRRYQR